MTEVTRIRLQFESLRSFLGDYGPRVSEEGMLITVDPPPAQGDPVEIEAVLRDGFRLLLARGEAVWSGAAATGGGSPMAAIRFVSLDDASRTLIRKLLEQRQRDGARIFRLEDHLRPPGKRLRELTVPVAEGPGLIVGDTVPATAEPPARSGQVFDLGSASPTPAALLADAAAAASPPPAAEIESEKPEAGLGADLTAKTEAEEELPFALEAGDREPAEPLSPESEEAASEAMEPLVADAAPAIDLAIDSPVDLLGEGLPLPEAEDSASVEEAPAPGESDLTELFGREDSDAPPVLPSKEAFPPSFVEEVEAELARTDDEEISSGDLYTEGLPVSSPLPDGPEPRDPQLSGADLPAIDLSAGELPALEPSADESPAVELPAGVPAATADVPPPLDVALVDEEKPPVELGSVTDGGRPEAVPGGELDLQLGEPDLPLTVTPAPHPPVEAPPMTPPPPESPPIAAPPSKDELLQVPPGLSPESTATAGVEMPDPPGPFDGGLDAGQSVRGAAGRSGRFGTLALIGLLAAAFLVAGVFFVRLWLDSGAPAGDSAAAAGGGDSAPPEAAVAVQAPGGAAAPAAGERPGLGQNPDMPADSPARPAAEGGPAEQTGEAAKPPPAASADDAGSDSQGRRPVPAATSIESIEWRVEDGETIVVLVADGRVSPARLETLKLSGSEPRLVLKISGIETPLRPGSQAATTAQLRRVRTGLHSLPEGRQLHVVLDLASAAVEVGEPSVRGRRIELRLTGGS